MSQAYRIGFKDISRDSQLSRLFIQKYMFASSGEDEDLDENLDGVRIDSIAVSLFVNRETAMLSR